MVLLHLQQAFVKIAFFRQKLCLRNFRVQRGELEIEIES